MPVVCLIGNVIMASLHCSSFLGYGGLGFLNSASFFLVHTSRRHSLLSIHFNRLTCSSWKFIAANHFSFIIWEERQLQFVILDAQVVLQRLCTILRVVCHVCCALEFIEVCIAFRYFVRSIARRPLTSKKSKS